MGSTKKIDKDGITTWFEAQKFLWDEIHKLLPLYNVKQIWNGMTWLPDIQFITGSPKGLYTKLSIFLKKKKVEPAGR